MVSILEFLLLTPSLSGDPLCEAKEEEKERKGKA